MTIHDLLREAERDRLAHLASAGEEHHHWHCRALAFSGRKLVEVEMVYRPLYFFTQAYHRGKATDVVKYLAENASRLGMLKRKRKSAQRQQRESANSAALQLVRNGLLKTCGESSQHGFYPLQLSWKFENAIRKAVV